MVPVGKQRIQNSLKVEEGYEAKLGEESSVKGKKGTWIYEMQTCAPEQGEGRKGKGSWPWMQTDRQGNQRQPVTFSAAGGSKALFKGLVNAGCC